jgi:hypothetical protein
MDGQLGEADDELECGCFVRHIRGFDMDLLNVEEALPHHSRVSERNLRHADIA